MTDRDPRMFPGGRVAPGPPRTRGPLPPADSIPPDLNIGTAQDEVDAWAHEHDRATELLAGYRLELSQVEVDYIRERAKARRVARASPTEKGRRTSADIDSEVDEHLVTSGVLGRKLDLEAQIEIALGRLFRARDNISRLDTYMRSLPREYRNA